MKKKILKVALVATFVAIAGYGAYANQETDAMSDLALANMEALAGGEWGTGFNCRWSRDWTVCNAWGTGLGCPCGSGQW